MSLTNVATAAVENNRYDIARRLVGYALCLDNNDPVVFCLNAEILKSEGKLSEAKQEYLQIKSRFPDNVVAQHAWFSLKLLLGESVDDAPTVPTMPRSIQDFYWVIFHISKHLRSGELMEAQKLATSALAQCPFTEFKKRLKQRLWYIQLQTKQLSTVLNEIMEDQSTDISPLDHVLRAHIFAASDRKEQANTALRSTEAYHQVRLIPLVGGLLRERYKLENAPSTARSFDLLDREIAEKELELILMAA